MERLDKKAFWSLFVATFLSLALITAVIAFVIAQIVWGFKRGELFPWHKLTTYGIWLSIIGIISSIYARLLLKSYHYELLENGFRQEWGVFEIESVTIPYNRIQSVDIKRSIMQRLLGIASVIIHTAGVGVIKTKGGLSSFSIYGVVPGIALDDAQQLRDELIKRSHSTAAADGL
jgi:uncharacterized membrane protein YdbT with pleckstrin-like domain